MDYNQNNSYEPQPQQNYEPQSQYTQPQYQQPVDSQYTQSQYQQPYYPEQPVYAVPTNDNSKGLSIASLVLGILSLTCCCGSLITSVIALVLGIISKSIKKENNGMATAGIILGAIGIVFSIIFLMVLFINGGVESVVEEFYYY
ncbi:MAG: DUF4190 domain-containing protein [Ruminococcaceae bacterium]|nr:DUF4190 domain-containing protein [Oscillospiraceae bacterium]